ETAAPPERHPLPIRRPDRKRPPRQALPRAAFQVDEIRPSAFEVEHRAVAVGSKIQVRVVEAFATDGGRTPLAIDPYEPCAGFTARRNIDERAVACHARHAVDVLDDGHRVCGARRIGGIERDGEHGRTLLEGEPAGRYIDEAAAPKAEVADRAVPQVD